MTQELITWKPSDSDDIFTAFSILRQHQIHHLPIVNNQGQLLGIITESMLLQALNYEQFAVEVKINQELQKIIEELRVREDELVLQNDQLNTAYKASELARQHYQDLFEFAPAAYLITDLSGIIQAANYLAASLLCVPQTFLVGKPLTLFIAQQDRYSFSSRLINVDCLQDWELYIQPRQGAAFPASVKVGMINDAQGEHIGWRWLFSNISDRQQIQTALRRTSDELEQRVIERTAKLLIANTILQREIQERKQAEAALRENEKRLNLALETANMGIYDVDLLKKQTFWSDNMGPLFGLPRSTLFPGMGKLLKLIHPEDRNDLRKTLKQSVGGGTEYWIESRTIWLDGSVHWLSWRGKTFHNEYDQPIRLVGTVRDITDRKEVEQKIHEQAALIDITTDAMLVRDLTCQILFWNQGAEQMYGWRADEVMGKNVQNIFYSRIVKSQEKNCLETVIKSGYWQGELRKITKSGKEITVESRWTLMYDSEGQPKSIFTVDTDITEKKQFQAQFFRAQRLESIGTLAGGIAHDINNVLTPILGSAQILKSKISPQEEQYQQLLNLIENNAKRGAALVRQVLSFASGLKGERTLVQVKYLIMEIVQIAQQTFPKSVKCVADIPENLWPVSGDSTQLHQVLMNLALNARDAMPNGGYLRIRAENIYLDQVYTQMNLEAKIGHYIMITITDTGIGIPVEILDRIFEPFFTTKEVGLGTGLGLSTVQGIIKSHGGFIQVSSVVDQGSSFKIFLPSVQTVIESNQNNLALVGGRGELILVVDDETAICDITTMFLKQNNYQTLVAHNGIEAIALYADYKQQINTILMDMIMPEMDGTATIRILQKMNPLVRVIACTGLDITNILLNNPMVELQGILPKPYTGVELLQKLNSVVQGGRG